MAGRPVWRLLQCPTKTVKDKDFKAEQGLIWKWVFGGGGGFGDLLALGNEEEG